MWEIGLSLIHDISLGCDNCTNVYSKLRRLYSFRYFLPVSVTRILALPFRNCSPFPRVVFSVLSWLQFASVSTSRPFLAFLVPFCKHFHLPAFWFPFCHFLAVLFLPTAQQVDGFVHRPISYERQPKQCDNYKYCLFFATVPRGEEIWLISSGYSSVIFLKGTYHFHKQ